MRTRRDDKALVALGRAIRQQRTARSLTQRELATAADVSPNQLSEIERGRADPLLSTVDKLARALDLTYAGLVRLVEEELGSE